MNQVQKISKIVKLTSKFEMIKFQLVIYAFYKNILFSDSELNAITYLLDKGLHKGVFDEIVKLGYFKTAQSARNIIGKANKLGILLDNENGYKINPDTQISTDEFTYLEIKAHNLDLK